MLEKLKEKWHEMFQQQTTNMRDLISGSVNEALQRRKEDREKRKQIKSNDMSSNEGANNTVKENIVKFYDQKINELE